MLDELLEIGDRVVARAHDDEQLEAIVVNEIDTEVRVYEGDIESFTSATSQGIGIRVIRDQRQGFAWAGSLDPGVIDSTLSEARDNAGVGSVDADLASLPKTSGFITIVRNVPHSGDDAVNGAWTLRVSDREAGGAGAILDWSLRLTSRFD